MRNYFEDVRYDLQRVSFDFQGGRYEGDGFLLWEPEDGFTIEARVERHGPPPPETIELRSLNVPKDSDYSWIRMKLSSADFAMTRVRLELPFIMPLGKWISIHTARMVFSFADQWAKPSDAFSGSALYSVQDKLTLPHTLEHETRLQGETIQTGSARRGILCRTDDGFRLTGRVSDDQKTMQCYWKLPKAEWHRPDSRRWPMAFRDALSIVAGQTVRLLQYEIQIGMRRRVEVRKSAEIHGLGICAPFHEDIVNAERLVGLAQFLSRGGVRADICSRTLYRLAEAARQGEWADRELIVATTLEAVLRTMYGIPYKKKFQIVQCLERFRSEFLSEKWVSSCDRALAARTLLRQRNAHLEWITEQGGSLSHEEMVKSVDAIIFLAHFYGYMILALAGFGDLEPKFPIPHQEWKPMLTYHSGRGASQ